MCRDSSGHGHWSCSWKLLPGSQEVEVSEKCRIASGCLVCGASVKRERILCLLFGIIKNTGVLLVQIKKVIIFSSHKCLNRIELVNEYCRFIKRTRRSTKTLGRGCLAVCVGATVLQHIFRARCALCVRQARVIARRQEYVSADGFPAKHCKIHFSHKSCDLHRAPITRGTS